MTIKVAKVIDRFTLVLNVGSADSVEPGHRFLVYSVGDEVLDPDTGESLGALEVVKGTGKATHVQERLTTVSSDMKASATRTVRRTNSSNWSAALMGIGGSIEETLPETKVPFEDVKIGDLVKRI